MLAIQEACAEEVGEGWIVRDGAANETIMSAFFPLSIKSSPVLINKALQYVVLWFGGIVRFTLLLPLHHISQLATKASALDTVVDDVGIVVPFSVFVFRLVRTVLHSAGAFPPAVSVVIKMAP